MFQEADILIIGAGPAGLTAARKLSEMDVPFTLVSRETSVPGESKACGGFIPIRALDEFGLHDIKNARPIRSIRLKFPGRDMARVDFDEPIGVNATRSDIGRALLNKVRTGVGAIGLGICAHNVTVTSSGCEVSVESSVGFDKIAAKMVIDASGVTPVSSKTSCVRSRLPNDRVGYAVQYQMRVSEKSKGLDDVNDFYYGSDYSPSGYAWVFPRVNEVAVGTGGIVSRVRASTRRTSEYLDDLISHVEPARSELNGAIVTKKEAALMPLAGVAKPSYADRVLLAGDAGAHCSPISGEGIHYAMVAGEKAAETAAKAVRSGDYSARSLSGYEKSWTKVIGSDLKWGLWLQKRFTDLGSTNLGSSFLKSERSRRIIAEMLVGERSVMSAIRAAIPGYLASKLR